MLLLEFPKSNLIFSVFNVLKDLSDRIDLAALCSDSRWKSWVRLFFTSLAAVESHHKDYMCIVVYWSSLMYCVCISQGLH